MFTQDGEEYSPYDYDKWRGRMARKSLIQTLPIKAPEPEAKIIYVDRTSPEMVKKVEESEAVRKELTALKRKLTIQSEAFKEFFPSIQLLHDLFADAEQRMEADTLDDIYGIGALKLEMQKLKNIAAKHIVKEDITDGTVVK
jgi:hypothetical protein